jgi:RCD1-SRO-TAF4 (RST) plant domain
LENVQKQKRNFCLGTGFNVRETIGNDKGGGALPSSPWMPFSMLFASISTKVSPRDMDCINAHYEDFKVSFFLSFFLLFLFCFFITMISPSVRMMDGTALQ